MSVYITKYLLCQPRYNILALSIIIVALIGVGEYRFDIAVDLTPLYLLPVVLSAVSLGFQGGFIAALMAIAARIAVERLSTGSPDPMGYLNAAVLFLTFLFVAKLLDNVKAAFYEQQTEAQTDRLTGLPDKICFIEEISRKLGQTRIREQPLTAVAISINDFTSYTAMVGSKAGDLLLQDTSNAVSRILRRDDTIGRVSDDTFMIALPNIGRETAPVILERIERHFTRAAERSEESVDFTIAGITFVALPANVEKMQDALLSLVNQSRKANLSVTTHKVVDEIPLTSKVPHLSDLPPAPA